MYGHWFLSSSWLASPHATESKYTHVYTNVSYARYVTASDQWKLVYLFSNGKIVACCVYCVNEIELAVFAACVAFWQLALPTLRIFLLHVTQTVALRTVCCLRCLKTRGTAIAVECACWVLIAPLRKINLPPIRPFNKVYNIKHANHCKRFGNTACGT